jgi:hypothetical protein
VHNATQIESRIPGNTENSSNPDRRIDGVHESHGCEFDFYVLKKSVATILKNTKANRTDRGLHLRSALVLMVREGIAETWGQKFVPEGGFLKGTRCTN